MRRFPSHAYTHTCHVWDYERNVYLMRVAYLQNSVQRFVGEALKPLGLLYTQTINNRNAPRSEALWC